MRRVVVRSLKKVCEADVKRKQKAVGPSEVLLLIDGGVLLSSGWLPSLPARLEG
jgi:hypothetical protein